MEALLESTPDTPSYMIGVQENKIIRVPLMDAVRMVSSEFLNLAPSILKCNIDESSGTGYQ